MEEDAGSGQLTSDPQIGEDGTVTVVGVSEAPAGRRWLAWAAAGVTLLSAAVGAAGYFALRDHHASQSIARSDRDAIAAATDCILATQPRDISTLTVSRQKLSDCATGEFASQVGWYSELMAQAYQVADLKVKIEDFHAGVERTNSDDSVVALVAFRTVISQAGAADRNNSYRVRLMMVRDAGKYKVAQLEQVAK